MRRFILGILVTVLLAVGVSANAVPARIADNSPTSGITGDSYHRAMAFGTDSNYFWVWGGGSLGSGSYSRQLWRYDVNLNTWSNAFTELPVGGEQYIGKTAANFGNLLIASSSSFAGCTTHVYNIDTNLWTTATGVPQCSSTTLGVAASQFYYLMSSGVAQRLYRLDITNPTGAWTQLADLPALLQPSYSMAAYDKILDRIVVLSRDNGTVYFYNISTNVWTSLGNIWTPPACPYTSTFCPPVVAYFDNALQTVVAVSHSNSGAINPLSPFTTWRLVWDSSTTAHFTSVETWTSSEFNYLSTPVAVRFGGAAVTLPSGNTRLIFGGGHTDSATPATAANRFWIHEQSPLVFVLPVENDIAAKIRRAMTGVGLDGTLGLFLFTLVTSALLLILTFWMKVSFNISLAVFGLWNGGLAAVVFLPGWILIVGVIIVGLGLTITIVRLFSGGSAED